MNRGVSRWGVGPSIALAGVSYAVAAGLATWAWPEVCLLATTGIFKVVRNPIYSAWIALLIPGLALLARSWPLFLTPLVAYLAFKAKIGRENEYLEKRFGEDYRRYKAEVNELVPFARWK